MRRRIRLLQQLLCLVLAVAAPGAGFARGHAPLAAPVLCAGHGTTAPAPHGEGGPGGREVLCPDCIPCLDEGAAPTPAIFARPVSGAAAGAARAGPPRPAAPTGLPEARAPPRPS